MKARKIIAIYLLIAIIYAFLTINLFEQASLFNYSILINNENFLQGILYTLGGVIPFQVGYLILSKNIDGLSFGYDIKKTWSNAKIFRNSSDIMLSVVIFYYLFNILEFFINGKIIGLEDRVFENKLSLFMLVFLGGHGFVGGAKTKMIIIVMISCLVSIIDASRSGIIPLAGVLINLLLARKRILSVLILLISFQLLIYSINARNIPDRSELVVVFGFLFPDLDVLMLYAHVVLDYIFSYSYLNFLYMIFILKPEYGVSELLVALNPIPSFLINDELLASIKLSGDVRAIGGPAEFFLAGNIYFILSCFFLGIYTAYFDSIWRWKYFPIFQVVYVVSIIIFFQYSVRNSFRVFEFSILIIYFSRFFIARSNKMFKLSLN